MPAAPILLLDHTDSTNAEARRRADAGETGPLWIVARRQTDGRGRRGRSWESQDGNLFATLMQLTRKLPAEAAQVTFVAALAIADLLDAWAPASLVTIKWPNDVMIGAAKLAGILLERVGDAVVVGIGVNLAMAPSVPGRESVALNHFGPAPDRDTFAEALAARFAAGVARWRIYGLEAVLSRWLAAGHPLGTPLSVGEGATALAGRFAGLAEDGALRLSLPDGTTHIIHAGEVNLAAPGGEIDAARH